jgi:hypothetical protein
MFIDSKPPPFKTCTMCKAHWDTCKQFVEDPELGLNGYLVDFDEPRKGLILVTHHRTSCGSTIAVRAEELEHMYSGPKHYVHNTGKPDCGGHCLTENDFSACSATCDMRWIRDVMQLIKEHRYPVNLNNPSTEVLTI